MIRCFCILIVVMKFRFFWSLFLIFLTGNLVAQKPKTTSDILEAGRLIVDIVTLFKSPESKDKSSCNQSVCFENLRVEKIRVLIKPINFKRRNKTSLLKLFPPKERRIVLIP